MSRRTNVRRAKPSSRPAARAPARSATPNTAPGATAFPTEAEQLAALEHERARDRAAALRIAVENAPNDTRTPSQIAAERYRVDTENYSSRERRAATYAMDFNGASIDALSFTENTGFPGFPTLALLAQLPEYRSMHETLAAECVRQWGKIASTGSATPDQIAQIEAELDRLDIKSAIKTIVEHDQAFGGGHCYFKLKGDDDFRDTPLVLRPYTVRKKSFEGVRIVEPYWVTPNFYNSIDPSAADFYKPSSWWMLGTEVHATRLQTIVSRPVPDMLKPTYSFRGVSMSQLAMPYVDNWLRTRQSVSDTIKQFSVSGVLADMQQMLAPGGATDLAYRAALINQYRDNRNILFLDKATEEFFQINTPLGTLDALQAQAQEQMSAVSHIPLIKLLGITPTGLNASSEGELRVFYDYVRGYQVNVLLPLMRNILRVIQLSLFGAIDEKLSWEWAPLYELTALESADQRAKDADTDLKYVEAAVLSAEDVRATLAADPHSRYAGILDKPQTLDEVPDDDIQGITEQILGINPADQSQVGASIDNAAATGRIDGFDPVTGDPTQPDDAGAANPTMPNDPSEYSDPGNLDAPPTDIEDATHMLAASSALRNGTGNA